MLRHQPQTIGLQLTGQGWAVVDDLLEKMQANGTLLDKKTLQYIVATNNKKRFAFSDDGTMIRASQGHSIKVDLSYTPVTPPDILFHGTAERTIFSILRDGLKKQQRQHVHLSADKETALSVGRRHGKPMVLEIMAGKMHKDGYTFFRSENGVWLTEAVPTIYLRIMEQ